MIAGAGALYYFAGQNRVTLANYNANGILNFEVNGGASAMTIDASGNLGLEITPSNWSVGTAIDIAEGPGILGFVNETYFSNNAYFNSGWKFKQNSFATMYTQDSTGKHIWNLGGTGTSGNAITFNQAMTLNNSGNLLLNTTSEGADGLSIQNQKNISFSEGSGESYVNIFRQRNSAAGVLAQGLKRSITGEFASSISSSVARSAVVVGYNNGSIAFYSDSSTTVPNGTDIVTLPKMLLQNTGNLLLNTSVDAGQKLQVNGTTSLNGEVLLSNAMKLQSNNYSTNISTSWVNIGATTLFTALVYVSWTDSVNALRDYALLNINFYPAVVNVIASSNNGGLGVQFQMSGSNLQMQTTSGTASGTQLTWIKI
jgi:hypothetical protein